MSKRVLRGNDINVSWSVNIYRNDGTLVDLAGMNNLGIVLIVKNKELEITAATHSLTIVGNVVSFNFPGRLQTQSGNYILKLYDKENTSLTYYTCSAFILVDEPGEDVINTATSIEIESSVPVDRTIEARGLKGDKGDPGTIGSRLTIGENGNWVIDGVDTEISAYGTPGAFKSIVFTRRANNPGVAPTGGNYNHPIPDPTPISGEPNVIWYDGIPDGTEMIWASSAVFYPSGSAAVWSYPQAMKDASDFDVEFAPRQENDAIPEPPSVEDNSTGNRHNAEPLENQIWFDPEKDNDRLDGDWSHMYWRAERKISKGQWGSWIITRIKGESGVQGPEGQKTAVASLYKRSAEKPLKPAIDSSWPEEVGIVYTFATARMISTAENHKIPSGWSMLEDVIEGSDPLWVITAPAMSNAGTETDTIFKNEWSDPVEYGSGDGLSAAIVTLYKRSATNPGAFIRDTEFDFTENTLTFGTYSLRPYQQDPDVTIDGWRRYIPDGTLPIWSTSATAIVAGGGVDVIEEEEWSPPARSGGENGKDGLKSAVVFLYRRSDNTLSSSDKPGSQSTYSFEEKTLLSDIGEWKRTVPNTAGTLWAVAATASCPASENTDTIAANEWSDPFQWGTNNVNTATIMLYKRSSSIPSTPSSNITYEFSTSNVIVGSSTFAPNSSNPVVDGWYRTIPSGSNPIYQTQATAASTTNQDIISSSEWSVPSILAENGQDGAPGQDGTPGSDGRGVSGMVYYYKLHTSNTGISAPGTQIDPTTTQGGSWVNGATTAIPSPTESNPYLWCFTRWSWTSGEVEQSNAYVIRSFNSQAAIDYNEVYAEVKNKIDADFGRNGTLAYMYGAVDGMSTTYVSNSTFSDARSTLQAGIDGNKAAITNSVSKGKLFWETPDFEAYQIKGIGGSPVGGVPPLKIGDVVVIYGKITATGRITSGYIYSHNGATTYTTTVPDYTPSTSASGSGTQSSPYNIMAARNNVSSSAMKYVKAKIVAKPEVYVDTNSVSNSYITLKLGDIFDYDAFRTSTYEDFATYESRVINLGYHISSYIDEMSAIRQQSDNILLAVGDGQNVAASIQLFKNVGTDGSKIVLDATHVEVNGDLSASIINAEQATIEEIVTEKISAQTVEAEVVKTGNSSVGTEISQGTFNIKQNGVTRARFGVDDNNDIVLQFLDSTGSNVLYEFGPTGILSHVSTISPKWNEVKLASVSSNIGTVSGNAWNFPSSFTTYYVFIDGEVTVGGLRRYYIYDQNENLVNHSQYHLKVFSNGGSGTPEGKTLITSGTYLNLSAVSPWQGAQVDTATNANIVQDRNAGYHFFRAYTATYSNGSSSFNDDFIFRRYNLSQDTAGLYNLPYGQSCLTRALYSNLNS